MLSEFVKSIGEMATRAVAPTVIRDQGSRRNLILSPDGDVLWEGYTSTPRSLLRASCLKSFIDYVTFKSGDHESIEIAVSRKTGEIFAVGDLNETVASLKLEFSSELESLIDRCEKMSPDANLMTVRDAVHYLECFLSSTGDSPLSLALSLSSVNFTAESNAGGTIARGKESLGKSVRVAVGSETPIPKATPIIVGVYSAELGIPCDVTINLFCDPIPSKQAVRLWTSQNEIDGMLFWSDMHVVENLQKQFEKAKNVFVTSGKIEVVQEPAIDIAVKK